MKTSYELPSIPVQIRTSCLCVVLIFCLALLVVTTGCGSGDTSGGEADSLAVAAEGGGENGNGEAAADTTDSQPEKKQRERTTSVNVAATVKGDLVIPVIAEGTIRSRQDAEIKTEISGRIDKVHTTEGQFLRKGQIILKLDSREYEVAADEARSNYLQALSVLAVEEDSVDVTERSSELKEKIKQLEVLERKGSISREERLAQEIALDVQALREGDFRVDMVAVRSGVTSARAALERAYLNLERTEIRAPFNGVITGLELTNGERLVIGETICTLVNNIDLEAEVGVLESDIGHLDVGRPALLAVPALGDTIRATVDVISPQFDRASRTCMVLLRVKSPEGRLRPGMFVRAIVAGETYPDRLLVPREAILTRDGRPLLFKIEGDRAKWLYLKVGKQNDYTVEIEKVLQGGTLEAGDKVVVSNHLTLSHEAKIKIKKTVPITDPWGGTK